MCSKYICYTFQITNNQGTDQTWWVCTLICAFAVYMHQHKVYLYLVQSAVKSLDTAMSVVQRYIVQ